VLIPDNEPSQVGMNAFNAESNGFLIAASALLIVINFIAYLCNSVNLIDKNSHLFLITMRTSDLT
jgi:hypothetical protein